MFEWWYDVDSIYQTLISLNSISCFYFTWTFMIKARSDQYFALGLFFFSKSELNEFRDLLFNLAKYFAALIWYLLHVADWEHLNLVHIYHPKDIRRMIYLKLDVHQQQRWIVMDPILERNDNLKLMSTLLSLKVSCSKTVPVYWTFSFRSRQQVVMIYCMIPKTQFDCKITFYSRY